MSWRLIASVLGVALMVALAPGTARSERRQDGNLIVALKGGVSPLRLPRSREAPVAVRLQGKILTDDGSPLPRVRRVRIGLAGHGLLSTRGLAICPRARLRNADSHQALERCRAALVGTGALRAEVFIPGQNPFTIHANLLAFNGRTEAGRKGVWVHAFSSSPPISLILPFTIVPSRGAYSTTLVAAIPPAVGPLPHLATFHLKLSRRFSYRGERRSYISASCPVPHPFTAGFLSFARATYSFADERRLSVETVRSCRAR